MKKLSLLLVPFLLSACAMKSPSFIQPDPIQIQNETVSSEFMADKVSKSQLDGLAEDIKHRAEGPVSVIVHYELKPPLKAAEKVAEAQGARVSTYLASRGVKQSIGTQLQTTTIPGPNTIVISYEALKASPAANCQKIALADANNYAHESDSAYRFGCARQEQLSAMIARPADLLGNAKTPISDSTRLTKSQDAYRAGERATKESDEGLSASSVYQE